MKTRIKPFDECGPDFVKIFKNIHVYVGTFQQTQLCSMEISPFSKLPYFFSN